MSNNWLADDFWQFSLQVYDHTNVKRLCLKLQNDYSLNVNVLLACAYLNRQNHQLNQRQFRQLFSYIADTIVQTDVIRKQRVEAKIRNPEKYSQYLAQELDLEKKQQQLIIEFLNQHSTVQKMESNFILYFRSLDCQENADLKSVMVQLADIISNITVKANL